VEAENILMEMIEKGLTPDVVTYTTLIDAYKRVGNIDRCWQIFTESRSTMVDDDADELLLSYMVRLAGATHDSEKAMKIFAELETDGFVE
jgi:pentatricopeptide repeat protein